MTSYAKYGAVALLSVALVFPTAAVYAHGTTNQTKATLAGAAAGAAVTGALGGDSKSMLLGAAAGGLIGNAYAYHNKKMDQKDHRGYGYYKVSNKKYPKYKKYTPAHRHHHHR